MNKIRKYPTYRDSGIEWIGEIPEHWKHKKLKYVANVETGNTPPKADEDNYTNGEYLWVKPDELNGLIPIIDSKEKLSEKGRGLSRVVPKNSILICCIGTIGKYGIAGKELSTNQQINSVYFTNKEIDKDFGKFVFAVLEQEHQRISNKVVVSIIAKSNQENGIQLTQPPKDEQKAIANFLDKKTALIDELIEKKKRQVELLKEQRQAVINQAVTKGLDPNVEMKDSCIEWLGEIPKHWDVKKLKLLCSQIGDGIHTTPKYVDSSNIYFINGNNLIDGRIQIQESTKCVDMDELEKYKIELKVGTILLSINGTIGNQAFYDGENVILGKSAAYMECNDELDRNFFSNVLKTHYIYNYFERSLSGTTIKNLSLYTINNNPVVLPNLAEQKAIVEYLSDAVTEINSTISKTEKQIQLLQEYRTALISEAVTGKIDVRDYLTEEV